MPSSISFADHDGSFRKLVTCTQRCQIILLGIKWGQITTSANTYQRPIIRYDFPRWLRKNCKGQDPVMAGLTQLTSHACNIWNSFAKVLRRRV